VLTAEEKKEFIDVTNQLKVLDDRRQQILARTGDEYLVDAPKTAGQAVIRSNRYARSGTPAAMAAALKSLVEGGERELVSLRYRQDRPRHKTTADIVAPIERYFVRHRRCRCELGKKRADREIRRCPPPLCAGAVH